MSAPPLLDTPTMPTMVSRLPKFGGSRLKAPTRPAAAAAAATPPPATGGARLTNGFYHHPGPAGGAAPCSPKPNGFLRAPGSLSQRYSQRPQGAPSQGEARKPGFPGRGRGFGASPASNLRGGSLRPPLSFARPRPGPGPGPGPGFRSGSPLSAKPPAGRSFSSDSLGSAPCGRLTEEDRLRSRSLTQVRRLPSPPLAPPRPRPRPAPLPPAALKKPLLPPGGGPAPRPGGVSYRRSRPSLLKQPRPLRAASSTPSTPSTPSTADSSPETSPEAPEAELLSRGDSSAVGETLEDMSLSSTSSLDRNDTSQEYMDDFDNLGNGGVGFLLLCTKNEEDDSGLDRSCPGLDEDRASPGAVTGTTGLSFLDEGVDWTGEREERRRRRSSQPDEQEQGGSSLDLSPSDSCGSAGTYMWDEEGLEPLGGAVPAAASVHSSSSSSSSSSHHIGSFDSDLNSLDLLNQLDSCDLAEDDLMLDVDFPEDASLQAEAEGLGLSSMAQWRKRQLCWGTQDVHDNEGDLHGDRLREEPGNKRSEDSELILDLRTSLLTPAAPPAPPALAVDVEELAEDCSAVRSQLEYLHRLLLQEEEADDDTLTTDTLSPDTNDSSRSSDSQVEALLQEVQQLREELRSRDRTIAQLTVQLTVPTVTTRCRCQETTEKTDRYTQTSVRERESVASQTPWREHTAPPPAPFLSPPWQYQRSSPYRGSRQPSIPPHLARKRVETLVLYFSDSACHRYFTPPSRTTRNH